MNAEQPYYAGYRPCPNPKCSHFSEPQLVQAKKPGNKNSFFAVRCFSHDCMMTGPLALTAQRAHELWNNLPNNTGGIYTDYRGG